MEGWEEGEGFEGIVFGGGNGIVASWVLCGMGVLALVGVKFYKSKRWWMKRAGYEDEGGGEEKRFLAD